MLATGSEILQDTTVVFVRSYTDCADLIVSTLYTKIGLYGVSKMKLNKEEREVNKRMVCEALESYIWADLRQLSTLLKTSFLYTTLSYGQRYTSKMNDACLSRTLKSLKTDLVTFMRTHAFFISYCDIEARELFMFTSGHQAICRKVFMDMHEHTRMDLDTLYTKYKNVPKSVKGILDDFAYLLDVRFYKDESLHMNIKNKSFPCIAKYTKIERSEIDLIKKQIHKGTVQEIFNALTKTYTILMPCYVFMDTKWMISMQGALYEGQTPLSAFFTDNVWSNVTDVSDILNNINAVHILKEVVQLNFLHTSLDAVNDVMFFKEHSVDALGDYCVCHIKNMMKFLKRNVNAIVLADMLSIGIFDMLGEEWQMDVQDVTNILTQVKNDIIDIYAHFAEYPIMIKLITDTLEPFNMYIKKINRYLKWLITSKECEDMVTQCKLTDMLFGDVNDKDGTPMTCSICLDNACERRDGWFELSCNHMFHMECVDQLFASNMTTCPLCRKSIN
jgi:hypothetical protein